MGPAGQGCRSMGWHTLGVATIGRSQAVVKRVGYWAGIRFYELQASVHKVSFISEYIEEAVINQLLN